MSLRVLNPHHHRPRRRAARAFLAVVAALALASTGGAAIATTGPQTVSWQPVRTIWDQIGAESISSVTTDSGLVVAAWSGSGFHNLWIAVRPAGGEWSQPTKIVTTAASLDLARDGNQAWLVWQGFDDVSALQIAADGSIGTAEVIGSSSDPFVAEPMIAAGANGSVAAAWRTHVDSPAMIAYLAPGGAWTTPEFVPQAGDLSGLVVGAAGTAQVVVATDNPDYGHQQLSYLRRTAAGTWSTPFVISSDSTLSTVAGDRHGDIVVGWEVENDDNTFTLVARYKAAESGFGASHHLDESVPEGTHVALAMASDGSLASAYQTTTSGSSQIQMTPADSTGVWLNPQTLSLTGGGYDVAMNSGGAFVVSDDQAPGLQLVSCSATDVCGAAETNTATAYQTVSTTLGPLGAITLVWGRGCKGEACRSTHLVAQRGR
jgi:hypothetical protein